MSPSYAPAAPRLALIRYAGLAGAALLAVAAYLGGALPELHLQVTPASVARGEHGPAILLAWLVGTAALGWAWWSARDAVPSVRWVCVTVGLWLLPLLVAPPLGSRDVYSYACQGAVFAAGGDPYRHGVAELGCSWVQTVTPIWRDTAAPYGPAFVLLAGAAAALGGTLWGTIALLRLAAVAGVALTAFGLPALARRAGMSPERAPWLALACPIVAVHLVSGAHNDALMVGLLVAGLAVVAARPGRPAALVAGGLLLGCAASIKVTAAVVVPFAALAAIPGPYRFRGLARHGSPVVGGAAAAVLGTTAASGLGIGWIGGLGSSGESVQWTAPPTAAGYLVEYLTRPFGLHVDAVPVTRAAALVLLAVLLVVLWWQARHRSPLRGAGLALAATVALAPVFHPWYAVWPLAVLAATRGPARWYTVPAAVASFLALPDGTNLARFTKFPGTVAMTIVAAVLAVRVVRRHVRPTVGTPAGETATGAGLATDGRVRQRQGEPDDARRRPGTGLPTGRSQ